MVRGISIIMNSYNRYEMMRDYVSEALRLCGVPYELIITDQGSTDQRTIDWVNEHANGKFFEKENIGNPQSFNRMLSKCKYNYIGIIAPDIKLPPNWGSEAIRLTEAIPNTGIVGFWCVGSKPMNRVIINDEPIRPAERVFGTWVISKGTIDKVGNFREFSKYGIWDSDYIIRCQYAGLMTYYHDHLISNHMGSDVGQQTEYRLMKDRELAKAKKEFDKITYTKDNYYVYN